MADGSVAEAQNGGGRGELVFALVVCALAMFLPVLIIQQGYDAFTSEHGATLEGAAGATLALAVVLRTVSRTVLRTIVRTSARAGLKAGVKGAMQGALRVATRNLFASIFKSAFGGALSRGKEKPTEPAAVRKANMRSLMFASVLLYASWVIVIGFGQPFATLMTAQQTVAAEQAEAARVASVLADRPRPEHEAYGVQQKILEQNVLIRAKQHQLKGERSIERQGVLRNDLALMTSEVTLLQSDLQELLSRSGGRIARPIEAQAEEIDPTAFDNAIEWLFTRAPYPGETPWKSPIIWAGAALFVLPLWFIYFAQAGAARREGVLIRHETGPDGGLIQLYFAGAFSYMPLSSDVIVEGDMAQKGRVSLVGLLAPTAVSIGLWLVWKLGGGTLTPLLFASDAFLIYPMVQCFPLAPLDGVHVWRWKKGVWVAVFFFVMGAFLFMGSEGLKNVI